MHTTRLSPARKFLATLIALAGLLLLAGCETVTLTNLTPPSMPENPSQIYTFSLRVTPRTRTVSDGSVDPHIVVDGRNYVMKKASLGEGIYEFEYQLPAGRDQVAYYFLVNYTVDGSSGPIAREAYTDVVSTKIARRYVISLEVNRGPVGSRISVLGRGFTPQDTVLFNGQTVRTVFESATSMSFFVPALEANKNYNVSVASSAGSSPVGTFRIDPSNVTVSPTALTLRTGERQTLTFSLPNPAPAGGTLLDVTTDIPESVIMPEVIVPQGAVSATVSVQGAKPGTGSLFLKGYGAGEVAVAVTVTGR
jgi:hypothetical protein